MRILVTGSAGKIGAVMVRRLVQEGHTVRTFDRRLGPPEATDNHFGDIRNVLDVRRSVHGMDAVVHLAALAGDWGGASDEVLTVNVQGTWNVLLACKEAGVPRAIVMSSVNSLGNFGGHRPSAYLPIDDDYPHHPQTPYQMSKHLTEELCRMFSDAYGLVTLCPRPMFVAHPESYARWREHRGPWRRDWGKGDYWAYVDVRDVCEAVVRGLALEGVQHECFLLAAPDTTSDVPTAELVAEYYPQTPWKCDQDAYLRRHTYVSLVDCGHVERVLGWRPGRSWRNEGEE